jgi:hypothetical protein
MKLEAGSEVGITRPRVIPCRLRWQPERRSKLRLCSVESPGVCHRKVRQRGDILGTKFHDRDHGMA